MDETKTKKKLTAGILAHVDAGKTTLSEAMLYRAGMLLYEGHTVGSGIMAVCACCYALADPEPSCARIFRHARIYAKWVYALHQPVGRLLLLGAGFLLPDAVGPLQDYYGLAVFVLCLLTAVPYVLIKDAIRGPAE